MDRNIHFSPEDKIRLRNAARSLGTTQHEFIEVAVRHAMDECEALGRDAEAIRDYYKGAT